MAMTETSLVVMVVTVVVVVAVDEVAVVGASIVIVGQKVGEILVESSGIGIDEIGIDLANSLLLEIVLMQDRILRTGIGVDHQVLLGGKFNLLLCF